MRFKFLLVAVLSILGVLPFETLRADEPPVIPIGYDAYRQWDRWAYQRIGARAYMRSTYDRLGANHFADSSTFLFQLADDRNVSLDLEGPGVLYFARFNHWHGSPWHFIVDGEDHVVKETSTANPDKPAPDSTFIPKELFPEPLAFTWSTTKGADLIWTPMPFKDSFRLAYGRTHYGTGYYIFHQYLKGAKLSQPIETWDGKTPPPKDVVELMSKAGTDLLEGKEGELESKSGDFELAKGESNVLLGPDAPFLGNAGNSPAMLRSIQFSAPADQALDLNDVWLRITWDGREEPSVDAPLPLFFGAGTFYNHDKKEHLVKAFPVNVRFADDRIHLGCYFPMPYFKSAKIELVNKGDADIKDLKYTLRAESFNDPMNHVGYFHATYRDHGEPKPGHDLVLLDTREQEGSEEWSGQFVGTSFIFSHNAVLTTLEGDPRFFFDDSQTPQAQGTGTEEWGGGGDYWGGRTMTLPLAGHPTGGQHKKPRSEEDKIEAAYRFLLADLMPFGRNARIHLEHGGENESVEHYKTVTYWYGLPAPSLIRTDELNVGDENSEKSHKYDSPDASDVAELTSRYEWGVDRHKGKDIFPAHTDEGRVTTGVSEFTLEIDPKNVGVMLRRKLDYAYPNQRAEVYIADASDGKAPSDEDFKPAGVWYLAGSNRTIWLRSHGEVGEAPQVIRESNRRFRDDEFLVPRDLTADRSVIRVRVKYTPVDRPLFPGDPLRAFGWSELHYTAYSYVMPKFEL